jgi:hypothetical protein
MSSAMVGFVFLRWWSGSSGHLSFAGLMPLSDAGDYFRCALTGANGSHAAHFPSGIPDPDARRAVTASLDWCSRRAIWPLALASVLSLAGWHAGIALVVLAGLLGLALGVAVNSVWRAYGLGAAVMLALVGAAFAYEWCVSTFMSEVWGVVCGLIGAAYLIDHGCRPSKVRLTLGLAMLSVALTARAGAITALPLLAAWAVLANGRPKDIGRSARALIPLLGLVAGPVLQVLGALHLSGTAGNTGGNFAATLYGLSTGSRDWRQAYQDFADLFSQRPESEVFAVVWKHAVQNIQLHPLTLFDALVGAGLLYGKSLFHSSTFFLYPWLLTALLCLGLVHSLIHWRDTRFSLLIAVFAAECLAAPLIIDSGGARVFAATFWVKPLLAGVGLLALIEFAFRTGASAHASSEALCGTCNTALTLHFAAVGVAALSFGPHLLSVRGDAAATAESRVECASPPVLARIGRESMAVTVSATRQMPLRGPLSVVNGAFEADHGAGGTWWESQLGPLPEGTTIMVAFDVRPGMPARYLPLIMHRSLPRSKDGIYEICVGTKTIRLLGGYPVFAVENIATADAAP